MKLHTLNPQSLSRRGVQWKSVALTGILTMTSASVLAVDYYVDAGEGNNANPCDAANPCKNIAVAYNQAVSGDDIYLVGDTPFEVGLPISMDITFHGEGKDRTRLHPIGMNRHFNIGRGGGIPLPGVPRPTVRFEDMTLEGGVRQGDCGGSIIVKYGNLEVDRVVFLNNQADCGGAVAIEDGTLLSLDSEYRANQALVTHGGAIYCSNSGNASCSALEIMDSELTANSAQEDGGALYSEVPAEIRRSDFYENVTGRNGGAIFSTFEGNGEFLVRKSQFIRNKGDHGGAIYTRHGGADIRQSAFEDNEAVFFGGGIRSEEDVMLVNSTFSTNNAGVAGGVFGSGSIYSVTMVDNSGDEGSAQDLLGTFEIYGSLFTSVDTPRDTTQWPTCDSFALGGEDNLVDDESCGSAPNFQPHDDPGDLGDLGYWGGRSRSYALEPTSNAEDGATNCWGPNGGSVSKDQRDVERPQGLRCDIGAFELEQN